MSRLTPALALAFALALAPPASARIIELGDLGRNNAAKPSCPGNPCLSVTRTTGFQVSADQRRNLFSAPGNGRIVAFTLNLGKPTATQIQFFNRQGGGTARARIATLRRLGGTATAPKYALVAQSGDFELEPHFGMTVQFPLYTSLLVRRGYVVALSVPTWAPVLAVDNLANTFSWRSSRVAPCSTTPERQPPHILSGSTRSYFCLYRPAQLTYGATIVTLPAEGARPTPTTPSNGAGQPQRPDSGGGSG